MNEKRIDFFLIGIIAVVFTLLFYNQLIGLNLFLFELILLLIVFFRKPEIRFTVNGRTVACGVFITAVFTLLHASVFVVVMNLVALFLFTGWLLLPGCRSMFTFAGLAAANLLYAPAFAARRIIAASGSSPRTRHRIRQGAYLFFPLIIILFFILFYSISNPFFSKIIEQVLRYPGKWLDFLLPKINFSMAWVIFLGIVTGVLFIFRTRMRRIADWDEQSAEFLLRHRAGKPPKSGMLALKTEYKAGIFLLTVLNLMILLQNGLDLWHVWFNFEWNGQYLRQFVHEGTTLLIISILVSIGIILWLYRGNLNFMKNNGLLKKLSYIWLVQNMVLVVSVAIRNIWYIHYFALAYKRIGVFIFLILTLIGLITVLVKVAKTRSPYHLVRVNFMAAFIVLMLASLVNWDVMIAKYNFSQYRHAFVHLDWLSTLSDKALPALDRSKEELAQIRQIQDRNFSFDHQYMSPGEYLENVRLRKRTFILDYSQRSILSFNLADYLAYRQLQSR